MKHVTRSLVIAFVSALAIGSVGCSTYVNIPAMPGDVAISNPDAQTVHDVIVPAMKLLMEDQKLTDKFQVVFPVKTTPAVAQKTVARISDLAVWQEAPDTSLPIYDIRQVRVRGMDAEVDVVRPVAVKQPDAGRQVATVFVHWSPFDGWRGVEIRVWRMSVDNALRIAPYQNEPDGLKTMPTAPDK